MGTKLRVGAYDCYEAAEPDEPMFVLIARDPLAADLVHDWAQRRLEVDGDSPKVQEAFQCALDMVAWRER